MKKNWKSVQNGKKRFYFNVLIYKYDINKIEISFLFRTWKRRYADLSGHPSRYSSLVSMPAACPSSISPTSANRTFRTATSPNPHLHHQRGHGSRFRSHHPDIPHGTGQCCHRQGQQEDIEKYLNSSRIITVSPIFEDESWHILENWGAMIDFYRKKCLFYGKIIIFAPCWDFSVSESQRIHT